MLLVHFILDPSLYELSLCLLLILYDIVVDDFLPKFAMLLFYQVRLLVCITKGLIHSLLVNFLESLFSFRHPCWENHIKHAISVRIMQHLLAWLAPVRDVFKRAFLI